MWDMFIIKFQNIKTQIEKKKKKGGSESRTADRAGENP